MTEPSLPEETLFAQALDLKSAAERAAFLDRACGNDSALRAEVEALLRAHEQSGDLLDLPENLPVTSALPAREVPGTVLGPYKLLEQIGEGGMGTVWMAEQSEPIQRRVALKIVKEGMDSKQVLARFEAERQALALMEHPNIAKVLDAGRTPSGRPYFVMELVKGKPITQYCDDKRLGVRDRLELFGDICRAVQHAHQKGIIHRDLKPSNVLVAPYDGKPVVKVIDFGVAKATGQRLTDKTLFTGFGALVGTPEYMSPEQAEVNNQDIDTRSDVYALGVLLYELLTGSTPLTRKRIKEAALLEVLRVIREEEPPRPSTRLSESKDSLPSISAQRQTEPAKLTKLVRGELDWIVMKALDKDRSRRYETANGFALDLQRYLADEPVQACPPSAWYRFRKFARRNKTVLSAASLVLLALVLGIGISTWQAIRATQAVEAERQIRGALDSAREEREKQQTQINRELAEALVEATRLREKAPTIRPDDSGPWSQLRETLRAAETLAGNELADPVLRGRVQTLLAEVKQDQKDRHMVAKLDEIRWQDQYLTDRRFSGAKRPVYEAAFREYGIPIFELTVEEAARRIQTSAIRDWLVAALDDCAGNNANLMARLLPIAQHGETDAWRKQYFAARLRNDKAEMVRLASQPEALAQPSAIIWRLAQEPPAIALLRTAHWRNPADVGINHALASYLLGFGTTADRRTAEAVSYARAALAVRPESRGLRQALFEALLQNADYADAEGLSREDIRLRSDDSTGYDRLGRVFEGRKDWDGAITAYRKSIGLGSPASYLGLGRALEGKGDLNSAIDAYRNASTLVPQRPLDFDFNLEMLHRLASALHAKGDLDEAITVYRKTVEITKGSNGVHCRQRGGLYHVIWDKGSFGEAIAGYEEAIADYEKVERLEDMYSAAVRISLAWCLVSCPEVKFRNPARAVELARKAVEAKWRDWDWHYWTVLGVAYYRSGDYKAAVSALDRGRNSTWRHWPYMAELFLAMSQHNLGNREPAHQWYTHAIQALERSTYVMTSREAEEVRRIRGEVEELLRDYPEMHYTLARILDRSEKPDEAIAEYREAIRLKPDDSEMHYTLARILDRSEKPDEAIAEYREAIRLKPDDSEMHYTLARILDRSEKPDEAIAEYREAIRLKPDDAEAHIDLGLVLQRQGEFREALAELRRGQELGSKKPGWYDPRGNKVRWCEQLVKVDELLPDILEGKTKPAPFISPIELAWVCTCKRLSAAGVPFYEEAFARDPTLTDPHSGFRYFAAYLAAQAGCGEGKDADKLDDRERARMRRKSLDWLRAELKAYDQLLNKEPARSRPMILNRLPAWLKTKSLAGVRGPQALAKLPEAERELWQKFWDDVATTLAQTRGKTIPEMKSGAK